MPPGLLVVGETWRRVNASGGPAMRRRFSAISLIDHGPHRDRKVAINASAKANPWSAVLGIDGAGTDDFVATTSGSDFVDRSAMPVILAALLELAYDRGNAIGPGGRKACEQS